MPAVAFYDQYQGIGMNPDGEGAMYDNRPEMPEDVYEKFVAHQTAYYAQSTEKSEEAEKKSRRGRSSSRH